MYTAMTACRERAVEILRGPDGERLWLALLDYAHKLARRRGWRIDKTLPQGFSPSGIANDVIVKVIEGERIWDETNEPSILIALKGMVRSDIGHLFDGYEASLVEPIERTSPDGSVRTGDSFHGNHPNPEQEFLHGERVGLEMTGARPHSGGGGREVRTGVGFPGPVRERQLRGNRSAHRIAY